MFRFEFKPRLFLRSFTGGIAAFTFITGAVVFPAAAKDSKAEAVYEAAAGLFKIELWEEAAAAYKEYFKKHPEHFQAGWAHYGLGLCYFNMKDYDAAAKELESAAGRKGPPSVETNLYLGQALMKKTPAMPKQAEQAFETGLKSMGLSKAGLFRGTLLKREWGKKSVTEWMGKTKEAKKTQLAAVVVQGLLEATYQQHNWKSVVRKVDAFEGLIKSSRVEQRALVLVGEACEKLENYKEAAVAYKAAANLKGTDASEALFRLGKVRLNQLKDFEAAAKDFHDFTEKYKSDSKRPNAAFNEALCFYHRYFAGKNEAHLATAIDRFNGFVKSNPEHELTDTAQFYVGNFQHIRKDWKAAVKALEPLMDSEHSVFEQLVFLVADSYHNLENWDKSAKFYMQFAKGNEKALNADVALNNAGVAYSNFKKPDTEQAIAAYKLLVEKCPNSPHLSSARLKLGKIYFDAKRFDEAKKSLQNIPLGHVLKADADYFLAWADLDNGKPVDAAKGFQNLSMRLARTTPKHQLIPLSNLYQGIAEFEGRRFTESTQTLSKFVSAFSEHEKLDEAAFNLGLAQMELRKWDDAVKSFETVPEKSNLHDKALYQAAWSKRSAAKPGEAIPYYKAFLEKHATSSLANNVSLELAEVEFEIGSEKGGNPQRIEDSVKRLMALLKKPALNAELRRLVLWRLGIVHFKQENYPESAKAFENLLGVGAGNFLIQAAFQAGEARRQMARAAQGADQERGYKAALKNFEIAVQAKKPVPGTEEAKLQEQSLLSVGQCKSLMGLWVDSQKSFELFIETNPKHRMIRTALLGLGWVMQNQENYAGAIKSFKKTVADGVADNTGARAQFLLGECYLEQEQHTQAIIEFAKVESIYKFPLWQSKAAYELAQALLQKENRDGARKQFERLIKRYPDTKAATAAKSELKLLN